MRTVDAHCQGAPHQNGSRTNSASILNRDSGLEACKYIRRDRKHDRNRHALTGGARAIDAMHGILVSPCGGMDSFVSVSAERGDPSGTTATAAPSIHASDAMLSRSCATNYSTRPYKLADALRTRIGSTRTV